MHTFEESLCSVEALGRELVVREGAEQLAHEQVGAVATGWLPEAHVGAHDAHRRLYPLSPLDLLQSESSKASVTYGYVLVQYGVYQAIVK